MVMNGFARLADAEIFSPGVILVRSRTERTVLRSSVSPEKALTEIVTLLRSSARRRAVTTISPAEAAIEDAASVSVEEAFGVSNRFSDAVCALEAVVTNAATVEDASSHALCPKFHLPFDIFSIFIDRKSTPLNSSH